MNKTALIHLVGEQPIPNLLVTRHINPGVVVLVHTERTKQVAERLRNMLSKYTCYVCPVDPYNLPVIQHTLQQFIDQQLANCRLLFNLTGGTKPMSFAAFLIALQRRDPFVYFQTEGGSSLLYRYEFADQLTQQQENLAETITLDDYLRVQVGGYTTEKLKHPLEQAVDQVLRSIPSLEVFTSVRFSNVGALEVDFVIRRGNRVGVIEVKSKVDKKGIDQIQAVSDPRYLGTYVTKFLISGDDVDSNNKDLAEAYKIELIELKSYARSNELSDHDKEVLKQRIISKL